MTIASDLIIYAIVHQPRRLRLPARPIPKGTPPEEIVGHLFDDELNQRYFRWVAESCYWPATELFKELTGQGLKLCIGFSFSFLQQATSWCGALLRSFQELVGQSNAELVGVEPYHSFLPLVDLPAFQSRMILMREQLGELFGVGPRVTDTTEMLMSSTIYQALAQVGFEGVMMDGREWVLGWREPTYLYHFGKPTKILARHHTLSDDVGYRFSNRRWSGYPLFASTYADWLWEAKGDFVLLGWDYETFGEHHSQETGIFDFMMQLPEEVQARGMGFATASEAIAEYSGRSSHLPLSTFVSTWAGIRGTLEFFLGSPIQQTIFQLMLQAYNKAKLTQNQVLLDLAMWLLQSDNLHLVHWYGREGSEAEVSSYFTPGEWWQLGAESIIQELLQVYINFLDALDRYL